MACGDIIFKYCTLQWISLICGSVFLRQSHVAICIVFLVFVYFNYEFIRCFTNVFFTCMYVVLVLDIAPASHPPSAFILSNQCINLHSVCLSVCLFDAHFLRFLGKNLGE